MFSRLHELVMASLFCLILVSSAHAVELGAAESRFTLDGRPVFLLGASYYGALSAPEQFIQKDLDDLQRHGFNWIRVWATWVAFTNDVSAVDHEGHEREPFSSKLKWLVAECDRRVMIVDVTLSRGNGVTRPPRLASLATHQRAIDTLSKAIGHHRNWYLDLANERNIRDDRYVSTDELRSLRQHVKQLDPKRLVTASHAGGDLSYDDVRRYVLDVGVDFLAPHRPRTSQSPRETASHTKTVLEWLRKAGRIVPVHYQEPFRRGYGQWQPKSADFRTDLVGAIEGGAAGWCFHNGDTRSGNGEPRRSFDMRARRLFDQLDHEELDFLQDLIKQPVLPLPN